MKPQQESQLFDDSIFSLILKLKSAEKLLELTPKQAANRIKMMASNNAHYSDSNFILEFANELYYLCCRYTCVAQYDLALSQLINGNNAKLMCSFLQDYPQIAFFLNAHINTLSKIYTDYFGIPTNFAKKQKTWKAPKPKPIEEEEFNISTCFDKCIKNITDFMQNENNNELCVQPVIDELAIFSKEICFSGGSKENILVLALQNVANAVFTLDQSLQEQPNATIKKIHQELSHLHTTFVDEYEKLRNDFDSLIGLYQ